MPRPELTSVRLERGEVCSRGAGSSGSGQDEEGPAKESAGAAGSPGGGAAEACRAPCLPAGEALGPASSVTLLPSPGSSALPGYTWGTCCVFFGCSYGTAVAYPTRTYQMQRDLRMYKQHPLPAPAGCVWLSCFVLPLALTAASPMLWR